MGVKSTVTLTREEAVARYVYFREQQNAVGLKRYAEALSDRALEDALEALNDEMNNGQGFDNYAITYND